MGEFRSCSKQFLTEFIELYKGQPSLWKVKSNNYCNKTYRHQAYNVLVKKLKEIEPQADRQMVVKKINSLRTAFRREMRKVVESKSSSSDVVYQPKLWYYHLLSFTAEQEIETKTEFEFNDYVLKYELADDEDDKNLNENDEEMFMESQSQQMIEPSTEYQPEDIKPVTRSSVDDSQLNTKTSIRNENLEHFSIYSQLVETKLRGMPRMQRIIAEKMINDVLFHGEMEKLNYNCAGKFGQWMENMTS